MSHEFFLVKEPQQIIWSFKTAYLCQCRTKPQEKVSFDFALFSGYEFFFLSAADRKTMGKISDEPSFSETFTGKNF
jgi:hypothetical protein